MTAAPLLSLLVPAVGGQGGGVLLDWIVDAALIDGYPVHGTSIPGVAQRTGSTTYYVEVSGERNPAADGMPIFSLYPVPGALDVLLAPEFLEVGRSIELGFPSPARTTIIASTHRLYSIHEKIVTGRGIYPIEQLQAAARAFSKRLIAFDALAMAREHGTEANAVLLGALAGSGSLPIDVDAYREAIRAKGVGVDANLRGFEAGLRAAAGRPASAAAGEGSRGFGTPLATDPSPATAATDLPVNSGSPDVEAMVASVPEALRPIVRVAIERLVDYQDRAYADRYLERLRPFVRGGDSELARIVAENRTTRDQIVELLRDFGTRYVVVEDAPFASPSLELLRQELHGEDFELLLAAPPAEADRLVSDQPLDVPITRIGQFTAEPGLWQRRADGHLQPLQAAGYQH